MARSAGAAAVAAGVVLGASGAAGLAGGRAEAAETPDSFTLRDPRIDESSGIAASPTHKGVYWTHNDSAHAARAFAVDSATGKTVATVNLRGVPGRDVEAISIGPDGDVYLGDIGDNLGGKWPEVWIYRFKEPKHLGGETSLTPTRYTVRYADGPRNAESLMVHPKTGRVYIASKNDEGKGGVYAGPPHLSASGVNTFRRVARTSVWATDGAFSPDGTRLMLRGYFSGEMYAWHDGKPSSLGGVSVPFQRQGESVTFTRDGRTLMFGSEGAHSSVEPVELDGQQLPESARHADGSGGSGGQDGKGGGKSGAGHAGGSDDDRNLMLGGATFVVAALVWMALRRTFRRNRS